MSDNNTEVPAEVKDTSIADSLLNEQIVNQQNQILLEVQSQGPLIGPLQSPSLLIPDYESNIVNSPGFIPGLTYLTTKYTMRKVRGDGNCFYRSFLFSYLENIIGDYNNSYEDELLKRRAVSEHTRMLQRIKDCKEELISLGYSEIAFECFYDVTLELMEDLLSQSRDTLFLKFQEDGPSEYYVWFMRLLTAGMFIEPCSFVCIKLISI